MSAPSAAAYSCLLADNEALRQEIRQLRGCAAAPAALVQAACATHSQMRFRTVFENSPLGQKIITPDLTIRQANQAVLAMLGCTRPEELIGHKILEFAPPSRRADWAELQAQLWKHKLPYFSLETKLVRRDGTSFWCQVHSVLFPDESGELGYTILEDISDRKGLEADLRQAYDAQETILQLASHDLKGPVTQIELLVDLLQRELADWSGVGSRPPEIAQYVGLIQAACAHAHSLLEDVLCVSDLGQHGLEKQPTDLQAYLPARLSLHQQVAQKNGVRLALDLPTEPVPACLHPEKFGRVLDNLLHNALKFTPAGGTVTLRLRAHAGRPRFVVQDTGIGIPDQFHAQLFDKFTPTRRAGLHGETTTGLGLFIARQLVELHGGAIWLESQERAGTSFFVDLP